MPVDALPRGGKARERPLVGRLDLAAQDGERGAAQAPQDLGVAPLALVPARAQFPAHQLAGALERAQRGRRIDAVALAQLAGREGTPSLCVAAYEALER